MHYWVAEQIGLLVRGDRVCVDAAALAAYDCGDDGGASWGQVLEESLQVRACERLGALAVVSFREPMMMIGPAAARVLRLRSAQERWRRRVAARAAQQASPSPDCAGRAPVPPTPLASVASGRRPVPYARLRVADGDVS